MQIFTYNDNKDIKELVDKYGFTNELKDLTVYCDYYGTRYSWGHTGRVETLTHYLGRGHIRYWNRTWEEYTYQSLIRYLTRIAMSTISNIDYNKVYTLNDDELKDIIELSKKDFRNKYTWCKSKEYTETKKHYKRIGVIK